MDDKFLKIKNEILEILKDKKEVTRKTKHNTGGIYMLYVDNFVSNRIIPVYIG